MDRTRITAKEVVALIAAIFALTACGRPTPSAVEEEVATKEVAKPESPAEMVIQGRPAVCVNPDVEMATLAALLETGGFSASSLEGVPREKLLAWFTAVTATNVDKAAPQVSCSAYLRRGVSAPRQITYTIRPVLSSDGGITITASAGDDQFLPAVLEAELLQLSINAKNGARR